MGTTGTRQQGAVIFPPVPAPAFPNAPTQARGISNFQNTLNLAQVQRNCNTMAGVAATAPELSVPGFPGIFTLIEDKANTTT